MNSFVTNHRISNFASSLFAFLRDRFCGLGGGSCSSLPLSLTLHLNWFNDRDFDSICSLLLDEVNQTFDRTIASVFDGIVLLASGVQFDGRESADIIRDIIKGCVAFGDNDLIGVTSIGGSQLFVFRCKILAVSTLNSKLYSERRIYPWSIKFEENILIVVKDNLFVVVRHDNGDWTFLRCWDGFALDTGKNRSV